MSHVPLLKRLSSSLCIAWDHNLESGRFIALSKDCGLFAVAVIVSTRADSADIAVVPIVSGRGTVGIGAVGAHAHMLGDLGKTVILSRGSLGSISIIGGATVSIWTA